MALSMAFVIGGETMGQNGGELLQPALSAEQHPESTAAPRTGDKPAWIRTRSVESSQTSVAPSWACRHPKPFRVPDWKIHGTNRHEMQRQRAEGDEERLGDIPGHAQHEITVAFRENPAPTVPPHIGHWPRPCGEFSFTNSTCFVSLKRLGASRSSRGLPGSNPGESSRVSFGAILRLLEIYENPI